MNCKPGDLAIVVIGKNSGKVFTCLEYIKGDILNPEGNLDNVDIWRTDCLFEDWTGSSDEYIEDELIRPIRDQPGEDESLTWAKVPSHDYSSV